MLKFVVDVNVPKGIWLFLKKQKIPFLCIHRIDPEMSDMDVAQIALREQAILLTCDKDFAGLQNFYPNLRVVIFETIDQSVDKKVQMLGSVLHFLKANPEAAIKCVFLKG